MPNRHPASVDDAAQQQTESAQLCRICGNYNRDDADWCETCGHDLIPGYRRSQGAPALLSIQQSVGIPCPRCDYYSEPDTQVSASTAALCSTLQEWGCVDWANGNSFPGILDKVIRLDGCIVLWIALFWTFAPTIGLNSGEIVLGKYTKSRSLHGGTVNSVIVQGTASRCFGHWAVTSRNTFP